MKMTCEYCRKSFEFKTKARTRKFCSQACYNASRASQKVELMCLYCKQSFSVPLWRIKWSEVKFCSKTCHGKWASENRLGDRHPRWRGGPVKKTCQQCGRVFSVLRWKVEEMNWGKFCSHKCKGKWQSENLVGDKNPNWKGQHIKIQCKQCEKKFWAYPHVINRGGAKFCSMDCYAQWQSENRSGGKSSSWRGGISFEPYPPDFNDTLRHTIRERDEYRCAICGALEQNKAHAVHHIDYDKSNNDPLNLICLCSERNKHNGKRRCHTRTNSNRSYWQTILTPIAKGAEMRKNAFIQFAKST